MSWYDDYYVEPPDETSHHYDEIIHETDRAILFRSGFNKFWLPKSVILDYGDSLVVWQDIIDFSYVE